jgi:hypothetical protein
MAEPSWGDLPRVLAQGLLLYVYYVAAMLLPWLAGAMVLAWLVHWVVVQRDRAAPGLYRARMSDSNALGLGTARALMPVAHLVLTGGTLVALLIVGLGMATGLPLPQLRARALAKEAERKKIERSAELQRARDAASAAAADGPDPTWHQWSPNQRRWPATAGYLEGLPVLSGGGTGVITLVNFDHSKSALYFKLCPAGSGPCSGLRHAYVPPGQTFEMTDLAPLRYELRCVTLKTGTTQFSETIQPAGDGVVRARLHVGTGTGHDGFKPMAPNEF